MASTTINPGLEIWHLSWKDDSFRMAEWKDDMTDNQITFSNGVIITTGVTGTSPSPVLTNGDELTLPAAYTITKFFGTEYAYLPIPASLIVNLNVRAKYVTEEAVVTFTLFDSSISPVATVNVTVDSAGYLRYTSSVSPSGSVVAISISTTEEVMIDYICFATSDFINQGGMSLDVTIPKKTVSQTVPNSYDIQQQVGISSRSKAVTIPKVGVATYRWLQSMEANSVPIELVTPTDQATGYLSDIQRYSEAGWVDKLLPSSDSLSTQTITAQEMYDISFTLAKADNEQNIYTSEVVFTPPFLAPTQVSIQPVTIDLVPIGSPVTLEVANFTEAQSAKLTTYSRAWAFLDTSLVIGLFNSTYTLTTIVPQQFATGEDIETLLAALQYPYQLLTDAEGYGDYVMLTQTQPSHTGGQPYYYSVDIGATSLGLPLIPPPIPPSPPNTIKSASYKIDIPISDGRNILYANGLWWLFYWGIPSASYVFSYVTSSTGSTWSSPTTITTSSFPDLNVWQVGTTIYYIGNGSSTTHEFYWRYGTLNSDGSITWTISETSVSTTYDSLGGGGNSGCIDTLGNIWFATTTLDDVEVFVYSGSYTHFLGGGAYDINSAKGIYPTGSYATYIATTDEPYLRAAYFYLYESALTQSSPALTTNYYIAVPDTSNTWSAISKGNEVYVIGINQSTLNIEFMTFTPGVGGVAGTWSTPSVITSSTLEANASITMSVNGSTLVIFYADGKAASTVYYNYSTNLGTSWSGETILKAGEAKINQISSMYNSSTLNHGVSWTSYTSPTYYLRFASIVV